MKKLFTILWMLLTVFGSAFVLAEEIPVTLTPSQQNAILWSEVQFDISISWSVTQDSKFVVTLPSHLKFLSATIPPRNLLQVNFGEQPYWLLDSGSSFSITMTAREVSQEFWESIVTGEFVSGDEWLATGSVNPIPDIRIEKRMTSPSPKESGDNVSFDIVIKNIWSKLAESVRVVDVWPNNILIFSGYWELDGTQIVPYIFNGNINQYEFTIWDMEPWQEKTLSVYGILGGQFSIWTLFENSAFALIDGNQYSTWNDSSSISWMVSGFPNVYVTAQKLTIDPTFNGDNMVFAISYWNNGEFLANNVSLSVDLPDIMVMDSASITWFTQHSNIYSWNLSWLNAWESWRLVVTWHMVTNNPAGTEYSLGAEISTADIELTGIDNTAILTWRINSYFSWAISAIIRNLTRPDMNDSSIKVRAISGDEISIEITVINSWNITQEWNLVVSNGNENWYFESVSLIPGRVNLFRVNKVVWPRNFQTISPTIKFVYGDAQTISTVVTIDEAMSCWDGLITRTEACDTASQEWILPWQHCADDCMSIITDNIINTACIEYTSQRWNWKLCDDAVIYVWEKDYMCNSITSSSPAIPVDDNGNWSVTFTCSASGNMVADTIVISCGNWDVWTWTNRNTYSHICTYLNATYWQEYHASCVVNGELPTNPRCEKDITAWYVVPNCGNGIIEAGEDCDLKWEYGVSVPIWNYLDYSWNIWAGQFANNWYSCKNCKMISGGNFVYEPAECLYSDTPISVMDKEIMPFWWRLWIKDTQVVENDNACRSVYSSSNNDRSAYSSNDDRSASNSSKITLLRKDSMMCTFAVYNGKSHLQWDSNGTIRFTIPCFQWKEEFTKLPIFKYFRWAHQTKADGSSYVTVNALLWLKGSVVYYWEYKLVLERVDYEYCRNGSWAKWQRYGAICEVDFAVTKPYIMQISTFGVNPVWTNGKWFLDDYYDMDWNNILDKTDLKSVISTDNDSYAVEKNVKTKFDEFKSKYEKLAVKLDNNFKINGQSLKSIFGSNVSEVKKVPNQSIYFIKWKWTLLLSQEKIKNMTSAYTIVVEWMDVEIQWDVLQYAMIVTDWHISFKDAWPGKSTENSRCANWWQVVQWIYVSLGWFRAADENLSNTSEKNYWCPWWGLHVKWVLIWDDMQKIADSKRSQLNSRFNVGSVNDSKQSVLRQRREKIIQGAAILIEYSPELWKTLPPWAEIFTESLEVYRK